MVTYLTGVRHFLSDDVIAIFLCRRLLEGGCNDVTVTPRWLMIHYLVLIVDCRKCESSFSAKSIGETLSLLRECCTSLDIG